MGTFYVQEILIYMEEWDNLLYICQVAVPITTTLRFIEFLYQGNHIKVLHSQSRGKPILFTFIWSKFFYLGQHSQDLFLLFF